MDVNDDRSQISKDNIDDNSAFRIHLREKCFLDTFTLANMFCICNTEKSIDLLHGKRKQMSRDMRSPTM